MCVCTYVHVLYMGHSLRMESEKNFCGIPICSSFAVHIGMELSCQDLAVRALPAEPSSGPWWPVLKAMILKAGRHNEHGKNWAMASSAENKGPI